LVASARAAVDKFVDMGVADRERIGVGGREEFMKSGGLVPPADWEV
jgi:hypothetical protein